MRLRLSLTSFVHCVETDCLDALEDRQFSESQRALLEATLRRLFGAVRSDDWGQPLGLFYAIYRLCGAEQDALAALLARFCAFYVASADLFDDVQDEDLAGKPHAEAGPAIATNSALTLLTLALDALGEACVLEQRDDRNLAYLRLFNRVSLVAVAAQHQDLMGLAGARTRQEVEDMHRGKTSSIALICECAALVGGASLSACRSFYRFGEELAAAVQVVDDVRDLVGKEESIDLLTRKSTYPLACFFEMSAAADRSELSRLLGQNPVDLDSVRVLLERSGTFDQCAAAVDACRTRMFELLDLVGLEGPHRQILGELVNQLACALYEPETGAHRPPRLRSPFAEAVRQAVDRFVQRMGPYGFKGQIELTPWHLPSYFYIPQQKRICFADLDGLPEEVLPFHAQLLNLPEGRTSSWIQQAMPFLIAHELCHAWRDDLGLLSDDAWHEERVANEFALAYSFAHEPEAARATLRAAGRMIEQATEPPEQSWLDICWRENRPGGSQSQDYDRSPKEAALVHAAMVLRLAKQERPLSMIVERWLPLAPALAAE